MQVWCFLWHTLSSISYFPQKVFLELIWLFNNCKWDTISSWSCVISLYPKWLLAENSTGSLLYALLHPFGLNLASFDVPYLLYCKRQWTICPLSSWQHSLDFIDWQTPTSLSRLKNSSLIKYCTLQNFHHPWCYSLNLFQDIRF